MRVFTHSRNSISHRLMHGFIDFSSSTVSSIAMISTAHLHHLPPSPIYFPPSQSPLSFRSHLYVFSPKSPPPRSSPLQRECPSYRPHYPLSIFTTSPHHSPPSRSHRPHGDSMRRRVRFVRGETTVFTATSNLDEEGKRSGMWFRCSVNAARYKVWAMCVSCVHIW